jgi:hypothetical protein
VAVNRWRRTQLRTSLTILLFVAGVVGGVVALRLPSPVQQGAADHTPTLERSAIEPFPAAAVAAAVATNDAHGLAQAVDADTLTSIQTQLKPLVSYESVTFVGATARGGDTLAGYIVRGRNGDGALGIVGLVIRLRDGKVVAQ